MPVDHFSIQNAVNAAQPGDLILIDPGVYTEEVLISTPDVIIRGRDRNTVFIDGLHSAGTGFTVSADGVAIENLTVRNYTTDGIRVGALGATPVIGFRALHVTTSNTGRNGLAVANSTDVDIRSFWGSGHAAAGISITDCAVCTTVVETSLVEFSGRGMSVVDAAGAVTIIRSTARNNRVGMVVENGVATTSGVTIAGSVVLNNGFTNTPLLDPTWDHGFGVGLHVGGAVDTTLVQNRIAGNTRVGILLGRNTLGSSDLPVDTAVDGNEVAEHPEGDVVTDAEWLGSAHGTIVYQNGPVPPGIEGMPDADSAIGVPAGPVQLPELAGVVVPDA